MNHRLRVEKENHPEEKTLQQNKNLIQANGHRHPNRDRKVQRDIWFQERRYLLLQTEGRFKKLGVLNCSNRKLVCRIANCVLFRSATPKKRQVSPKRELRHSETPVVARKSEKKKKGVSDRKSSSVSR